MCRKLLCLVALLGMVSVASAQSTTVIDDFESYWGTPAMVTPTGPWSGQAIPGTSNVLTLITAGGAPGQYLQWDWTNSGGWLLPNDPTNYDPQSDHVEMGTTMPGYDVTPLTRIHMSLQIPSGAGTPPGEYLLEYTGDQWSQTWIPAPGSGAPWWIPPEQIPAKIGPDSDWGFGNYDYSDVPSLEPNDTWVNITVNPDMYVAWGAPLVDFDDMNALNFAAFGNGAPDTSGASGASKVNGTDVVWPPGPISGTLLVDTIWFEEVPEPMTIALLGLGGLALIRRKR